jgi:hypothetical protein
VAVGTVVFDYARITGSSADGTPTGTVTFFICTPSQVSGGVCASGGTQVGTAVTATAVTGSNPPQSQATSNAGVTASSVGVWCFRAVYAPTTTAYLGSSDASSGECFTVTDTTKTTTAQTWLPNDSSTITSTGGTALNGTVVFQLFGDGTCGGSGGSVLYTEPTITLTNASSPDAEHTNNTSVQVNVTKSVSWLVTFTPTTGSFVSGSSHCEVTALTITN